MPLSLNKKLETISHLSPLLVPFGTPLNANAEATTIADSSSLGFSQGSALPAEIPGRIEPAAMIEALNNAALAKPEMATGGSREAPISHEAPMPANRFFERWYESLRLSGADARAREALLERWAESSEMGASWISSRILSERQLDALEAAGEILSRLGRVAVPFTVGALRLVAIEGQDPQVAIILLHTLRKFGRSNLSDWTDILLALATRFSTDRDRDLREAAFRATESLPGDKAAGLLESVRNREEDEELRDLISEMLENIR